MARTKKNEDATSLKDDSTYTLVEIPFDGFYESLYSGDVDREDEQESEAYENGDSRDGEENCAFPPELRINASEYAEILFDCTDYGKVYALMAHSYADTFKHFYDEATGLETGLVYEGMESPQFYNYGTDRLFSYIPRATVQTLFDRSAENEHAELAELLRDKCTSYSGFSSHYSNELQRWLAKPLADWDHNELKLLLMAVFNITADSESDKYEGSDFSMNLYYAATDCDGFYNEISEGRDWSKIGERVAELREEKRLAYEASETGQATPLPPRRCAETPDMFKR